MDDDVDLLDEIADLTPEQERIAAALVILRGVNVPITPEQAMRCRAVFEQAQAQGQHWVYELNVRLPWWRRLLGRTRGGARG